MSFLLALIPAPYRILALAIAVALAAAAAALWLDHDRDAHETIGENRIIAKWKAEKAEQLVAAIKQSQANAAETQRRLTAQKEADDANAKELARYQKVAADAVAERDRLRSRADQLAALVRRGSSDTATGRERQDAGAAAGMLADLSGRTDAFAEVAGRYADALRRSNKQCERDYDALDARYRKALTPH